MIRVSCGAKCEHNSGGRCGRRVMPGETVIRLDQSGRCANYRPG